MLYYCIENNNSLNTIKEKNFQSLQDIENAIDEILKFYQNSPDDSIDNIENSDINTTLLLIFKNLKDIGNKNKDKNEYNYVKLINKISLIFKKLKNKITDKNFFCYITNIFNYRYNDTINYIIIEKDEILNVMNDIDNIFKKLNKEDKTIQYKMFILNYFIKLKEINFDLASISNDNLLNFLNNIAILFKYFDHQDIEIKKDEIQIIINNLLSKINELSLINKDNYLNFINNINLIKKKFNFNEDSKKSIIDILNNKILTTEIIDSLNENNYIEYLNNICILIIINNITLNNIKVLISKGSNLKIFDDINDINIFYNIYIILLTCKINIDQDFKNIIINIILKIDINKIKENALKRLDQNIIDKELNSYMNTLLFFEIYFTIFGKDKIDNQKILNKMINLYTEILNNDTIILEQTLYSNVENKITALKDFATKFTDNTELNNIIQNIETKFNNQEQKLIEENKKYSKVISANLIQHLQDYDSIKQILNELNTLLTEKTNNINIKNYIDNLANYIIKLKIIIDKEYIKIIENICDKLLDGKDIFNKINNNNNQLIIIEKINKIILANLIEKLKDYDSIKQVLNQIFNELTQKINDNDIITTINDNNINNYINNLANKIIGLNKIIIVEDIKTIENICDKLLDGNHIFTKINELIIIKKIQQIISENKIENLKDYDSIKKKLNELNILLKNLKLLIENITNKKNENLISYIKINDYQEINNYINSLVDKLFLKDTKYYKSEIIKDKTNKECLELVKLLNLEKNMYNNYKINQIIQQLEENIIKYENIIILLNQDISSILTIDYNEYDNIDLINDSNIINEVLKYCNNCNDLEKNTIDFILKKFDLKEEQKQSLNDNFNKLENEKLQQATKKNKEQKQREQHKLFKKIKIISIVVVIFILIIFYIRYKQQKTKNSIKEK